MIARAGRGTSALLLCAATACSDLTNTPAGTHSLAFDSLPASAVVLGDSLRDSTGAVKHLSATAYDGAGHVQVGASVRFISLDTGVTVDSTTGLVVGTLRRATPARLVAGVGAIQTSPKLITVTNRPDTASKSAAPLLMVYVTVPRTDPANTVALTVRVGSLPAVAGVAADSISANWAVRYTLVRAAAVTGDSTLLSGGIANSAWAVSDASGNATKSVRVVPKLGTRLKDTVIVDAAVSYKGVALRGSPLRFIVPLTPKDSL